MSTPPRYAKWLEYKATCEAAFTAAGLNNVTVTADAHLIESASRHGVLVFPAPDLNFITFEMYEATYEAVAIAGPADNLDHAWRTLDAMLEALFQADVPMTTATADTFAPPNSLPLPGYSISFATDTAYKETTP